MASQNGSLTLGTFLGSPLEDSTHMRGDMDFSTGNQDPTYLVSHVYVEPLNRHRAVYADYLDYVGTLIL